MEWLAARWRQSVPNGREGAGKALESGRAAVDALLYATPDGQPPIFSAAIH
ncbi:hypothetical protein LGM71_07565 [Burkholderia sp. AU33545]|uniref:hypothetical protein n=1 Tax=Burkholderia sp. AU33545 TaxID=2879631 RepID=UPI001CF2911B|nr:hypothetical protein [Burkholderia sp. AU33545]MCA8200904.1 hypothetical protein [Burkholderia sp. AU33545]